MVIRIDFESKNDKHTGFIIMISRPQAEQKGRRPKSPWHKGVWGRHPHWPQIFFGWYRSPVRSGFLFLDSIWWLLVRSGDEFIRYVQISRKPNVPKLKHAEDHILKKMMGRQKK